MSQRQLIGLSGALILLVGVFLPIASLPFFGAITYIRNGRADGVIVLVLALISIGLVLTRKYRETYLTASTALGVIAFTLTALLSMTSKMQEDIARSLKGNIFAGIGEALSQAIQIQWGWAILFVGAGLLIVASLMTHV